MENNYQNFIIILKNHKMRRKYFALLVCLWILSCSIYIFGNSEISKRPISNGQESSIPTNWKTYSNDQIGITFSYPNTWSKNGTEINATDLSGTVKAIEINFTDTIHNTNFSLKFYPNGSAIYKYALSQFNTSHGWYEKDGKKVIIDGSQGIQAFTTISRGAKGNVLNPPNRIIIVDFLDKNQIGAIQLQFNTPLNINEESEVIKFNQLLSSFRFIN